MSALAALLGETPDDHPLKTAFLKWQCRVRQMAMRDAAGRPDDAVTPAVVLDGDDEPLGHVITVLNKSPRHSVATELDHMAARTNDPAQIREQALRFLSAAYYQKPREFSDVLTATFPPGSPGAAKIRAAEHCTLVFDAFAQRFDLRCRVWRLASHHPLHRATFAHNRLFNPTLHPDTEILAFEPDWTASSSDPKLA